MLVKTGGEGGGGKIEMEVVGTLHLAEKRRRRSCVCFGTTQQLAR